MGWWRAPDVTEWPVDQREHRGGRVKVWVSDPTGQLWLRKEARELRPREPVIEALTLELAHRCGLDVSYGRPCEWVDSERTIRGFISRKFHDSTEEQASGSELVGQFLDVPFDSDSERKRARPLVTLEVVRLALDEYGKQHGADLLSPFLRMLAFDAWIGNGDRHSGNWAILRRQNTCRLAPIYDTAACLGAELTDERVAMGPPAIARYVRLCRSGFGDGARVSCRAHADVLASLASWAEWENIAQPLFTFIISNLDMIDSVLGEIPDDWFPEPRKRFVTSVLVTRARLLAGALP